MLDREARRELLTLSKANGADVARHLVMAGILLADDPETAYLHAQAAGRGAGRVAVAREGVAITSYATGRYAEALKELRAVRRLSGRDEHRVMEADCERGLGRPERALQVIAGVDTTKLSDADRAELAIVASGARADLGEHEAGLLLLRTVQLDAIVDPSIRARLDQVIADRLDELGRADEAAAIRRAAPVEALGSDLEFDVIDLDPEDEYSSSDVDGTSGSDGRSAGDSHGAVEDVLADGGGSDRESRAEAAPTDSAETANGPGSPADHEGTVPSAETDTEAADQSLPAEDDQVVGSDETAQPTPSHDPQEAEDSEAAARISAEPEPEPEPGPVEETEAVEAGPPVEPALVEAPQPSASAEPGPVETGQPSMPAEPELPGDRSSVDDAQDPPKNADDADEQSADVTDDDGQLELDLFAGDAPAPGHESSTDGPPTEPRTGTMFS